MIENLSLFYESIKKAVGGAASVDALSDEALAALLTSSLTVDAFVGIIDPCARTCPTPSRSPSTRALKCGWSPATT